MSELRLELAFQAIDQSVCAQFRQQGVVEQRAVLMTYSGLLVHPLGWESDGERAAQLKALQVRMRKVEPIRYALIGEAWVADWNEGDAPLPPSKSEIRKDCLYVFLSDVCGRSILGYREISRPLFLADPPPRLGALVLQEDAGGPFAELTR